MWTDITINIPSWVICLHLFSGLATTSISLWDQWYEGEGIMGDDVLFFIIFTLLGLITFCFMFLAILDDVSEDTTVVKGKQQDNDRTGDL